MFKVERIVNGAATNKSRSCLVAEGKSKVQQIILGPGDAVFIPIGYFHTVASAVAEDQGLAEVRYGSHLGLLLIHLPSDDNCCDC